MSVPDWVISEEDVNCGVVPASAFVIICCLPRALSRMRCDGCYILVNVACGVASVVG